MKKLYQEFFCIPEQGKVSDKVLLVRMAAAAVFMVLCLCGMSASAYAYFTCSVSSAHNVIQSGQFTADATITNNSVAALSVGAENMSVATENERFFSVEDLPAGEYTVTLRPNGTASTGFFILTVGGVEYYTQQLVVGSEENPLSFLLVLAEPADVTLLAHWGTVSSYPTEGKNYIGADTLRIAPFGEWTPPTGEEETKDEPQKQPGISEYTVLAGDSAESIAQAYGVTVENLLAYNEITEIMEGNVLKIPPADWKPEENAEENGQEGDQTQPDAPAADPGTDQTGGQGQQEEQTGDGNTVGEGAGGGTSAEPDQTDPVSAGDEDTPAAP